MIKLNQKLNLAAFPAYQKRVFLPEGISFNDIKVIRSYLKKLLGLPVNSLSDFNRWIGYRSELEAAVDEQGTVLYIEMTRRTDDKIRVKRYQDFIKEIVPVIESYQHKLNLKYLKVNQRFPLDQKFYNVYNRHLRTDVEIFDKRNIPLQTQVNLLSQQYQSICGAMTVTFKGREYTLAQMSKFFQDPSRDLREQAWRIIAQRRLRDKDKINALFDKMFYLRRRIAQNARCKDFLQYQFKALHRFSYTPADCKNYHQTVERLVVPSWEKILKRRKTNLKLNELRPWDMDVDVWGRLPLQPFRKVTQLIKKCAKVLTLVDKDFGLQFTALARNGLLDLENRKGKAPGGYQSTLNEIRQPFIFMNAVGKDDDVRTLLHEAGHAFHTLACAHHNLLDYRHGPMEFNEVASMSMELLADRYLNVFYSTADYRRSRSKHFEDIVYTFIWVAIIDSFQHWIYENPAHSDLERQEAWKKIYRRFGGDFLNWEGLEEELSCLWQRQLHIFEYPFYYIEYAIAQIGALQLWLNARKDQKKTIGLYRHALSLGGSKHLSALFQKAGIRFGFSASTIEPLMKAIRRELP